MSRDPRLIQNAQSLRKTMTPGESALWVHIRNYQMMGLKCRRQVPISSFIADFLFPEVRLIVEIDGYSHFTRSYSHSYDVYRERTLEELGYILLRFTENEAKYSTNKVLITIEKFLSSHKTEVA